MIEMKKPSRLPNAQSHLDEFLFAFVSNEGNGTPLTVVSALARADVDPWLEAESLAKMPTKAAAERLRALIYGSPGERFVLSDRFDDKGAIINRLLALLPRRKTHLASPPNPASGTNTPTINWQLAFYITLGLIMSIQLLSRSATNQPHLGGIVASPFAQTVLQPKAGDSLARR